MNVELNLRNVYKVRRLVTLIFDVKIIEEEKINLPFLSSSDEIC